MIHHLRLLRPSGAPERNQAAVDRPGWPRVECQGGWLHCRRRSGARWPTMPHRTSHRGGGGRVLTVLQNPGGLVLVRCGQRVEGRVGQCAGAAIALLGVFGHASGDHLIQGRRNHARSQFAGSRGRLHQMRCDHPFDAVRPVRRQPGQTLVQHAGQRVDVRAISDLVAGEPLWGHVLVGSHRRPRLGKSRVGGCTGNTEIHQIGEVIAGYQNIFRLDVTVGHAGGVRGIQRSGDLAHDGNGPWWAHWPGSSQHGGQVGAVDQAHVQIQLPVNLAVVVDRHHVWLGQPASGVGLALHPGAEHRISGELPRDQLQRHHPAFTGVLGLIDVAHPAAAEQSHQPIGTKLGPHQRTRPAVVHPQRSLPPIM